MTYKSSFNLLKAALIQINSGSYAQAIYNTCEARTNFVKLANIKWAAICSIVTDHIYERFREDIEECLIREGKTLSAQNLFEAIMDSEAYTNLERYLEKSNFRDKQKLLTGFHNHFPLIMNSLHGIKYSIN